MAPNDSHTRTNRELLKALRTPVARFYPCDLHVHSPGSFDVCLADRFSALPEELRAALQLPRGGQLPLSKQPADPGTFDRDMATPENVAAFLQALVQRRDSLATEETIPESDNWAVIGVTDHNTAYFSAAVAAHAWEHRAAHHLIILPGLELDVIFPIEGGVDRCRVHVLCLFAPGTTASDIRLAINDARPPGMETWDFGGPMNVSDLPNYICRLRSQERYPAMCIAAHIGSSKGIEREPKNLAIAKLDASIARIEGELERVKAEEGDAELSELTARLTALREQRNDTDGLHMQVLALIGQCGFDALQVRDQDHEIHYRRLHRFRDAHGRAIPIVCSDAHSPPTVFDCGGGIPYAKLDIKALTAPDPAILFHELRKRALRFGETRTTYASPGAVAYWIEGLEIVPDAENARRFWQLPPDHGDDEVPDGFTLSLSRNLNCFVGGRGSGKSAGVEAIAFLAEGDAFATEGAKRERDWPDWYRRAAATLSGCKLRLVWKASGAHPIGNLPKRSLIVSRYFDPDGRHSDVEIRDADGNAIVDDHVVLPQIRILRAHEIERTAESGNLRQLFDDLCGTRIADLNEQVCSVRESLIDQRAEILETCQAIAELTQDGSALRQYGLRKLQFERVDKPDLRARFEEVDHAEAISKAAAYTSKLWQDTVVGQTLSSLESDVGGFFDTAVRNLTHEDGSVLEGHDTLHALVRESPDPDQPAHRETILHSIRTARSAVGHLDEALNGAAVVAENTLAARRDELARDGLPTGSSERESKKRAFDDARSDYQQYRVLCETLVEQLAARDVLQGRLVAACRERTELRKHRAEALTDQLRHDLDQEVLTIEVDARPLADRREFAEWIEQHVGQAFQRYRAHRCTALMESGLMPRTLRDILLDSVSPDVTELHISKGRAEDGRIDAADCQKILDLCRGRKRVPLDESENWDEAFRHNLPDDIRDGVLTFPAAEPPRGLCIDHVLQLDELVLDDIPEVRLNDRPTDSRSEPRPLEELSPGQRCSAILPILLLSGDYPLVVDQPEENLDNRLIRQVIVNILASMKLRRQVIIATHNPNLPVLGDVEQCVILQATARDLSSVVAAGNLDSAVVARYITDIMEGGREAFQYRQSIYQAHWDGPVEVVRPDEGQHSRKTQAAVVDGHRESVKSRSARSHRV